MERKTSKNLREKTFRRIDPMLTKIKCCRLPDGKLGEVHYIPRLNMTIGIDPEDDKAPVSFIYKKDDALKYNRTSAGPVASIMTKEGELLFSTAGIKLPEGMKTKSGNRLLAWNDGKQLASVIGILSYNDPVFQASVSLVPGGLRTVVDPCGLIREGIDIIEDIPEITECFTEFIPAVVETVDRTADCIRNAGSNYGACNDRCGRKKWWKRPGCYAGCALNYAGDVAWCVANGIIEVIVEAAKTIEHCVLKRGVVTGAPTSGDIILFEADSAAGHAIDFATCGYGYSHSGLVCNGNLIHATGEGVVAERFENVQGRDHSIVRLGLTPGQISALCSCVRSQIGQDYDYLEAVTFGTIDNPGSEICTMLIMHCLDEIGVNRNSLGLGGFVSPNDIARTYDVPHGHLV